MSTDPLIDTVDRLLENARPGGTPHRRLLKYREQLERNVMLGPSVLKYLRALVHQLDVTIECRHLTAFGVCRKLNRECGFLEDNAECKLYEKNRPQTKGNPLGRIG